MDVILPPRCRSGKWASTSGATERQSSELVCFDIHGSSLHGPLLASLMFVTATQPINLPGHSAALLYSSTEVEGAASQLYAK